MQTNVLCVKDTVFFYEYTVDMYDMGFNTLMSDHPPGSRVPVFPEDQPQESIADFFRENASVSDKDKNMIMSRLCATDVSEAVLVMDGVVHCYIFLNK